MQWGPAYCPKHSKIEPSGYGNCTKLQDLVDECKEFIIAKLVIKGTVTLAKKIAGFVARRRRLEITVWEKVRHT